MKTTQKKTEEIVLAWIADNHPAYAGWRLRSLAWEYDVSDLPLSVANMVNDKLVDTWDYIFDKEDFKDHIERVKPPEGFIYITVEKDGERIGINVPTSIYKTS